MYGCHCAGPLKVLKRKLKDQDDNSEVSYDLPATVKDLEVQSLVPMRRGGGGRKLSVIMFV